MFGETRKAVEPAGHAQFAVEDEQWLAPATAPQLDRNSGRLDQLRCAVIIAAMASPPFR